MTYPSFQIATERKVVTTKHNKLGFITVLLSRMSDNCQECLGEKNNNNNNLSLLSRRITKPELSSPA